MIFDFKKEYKEFYMPKKQAGDRDGSGSKLILPCAERAIPTMQAALISRL